MEDKQAMHKLMNLLRLCAILILLLHLYFYLYPCFEKYGFVNNHVDDIFFKFIKTGIFHNSFITRFFSFLLLSLSCIGTKGIKNEKITRQAVFFYIGLGIIMFFASSFILNTDVSNPLIASIYALLMFIGFAFILKGGTYASRLLNTDGMKDLFNEDNETFPQETLAIVNEFSVNLNSVFIYKKKQRAGKINVVNPFRATMVLGTPGSGKSFAIINEFIMQHIEKGFSMFIYDYKFPDLTRLCYNVLLQNISGYKIAPKFYIINFDDLKRSHRCNPLLPSLMTDIVDAYQSTYTVMLCLNKSWITKQGDFFVESPINFVTAAMWFLRVYDNGKYCTFPHVIEFINRPYEEIFPIMMSYQELENYVSPFKSAFDKGALEQLEGQIASAKIGLSRMASPQLYWVMTGNDFTLDINNPVEPKILCVGNNPDRQDIYSAALGLYNARLVKLINKKGQNKTSLIVDELPTTYIRGLDNLIATARSNKISTCLGFQDYSQLIRDYGDKEAKVIINTIGNVFTGSVSGDTAEQLSKRFGKINQRKQSVSYGTENVSISNSVQLDMMIPSSKISNLTQGSFVGAVADNIDEAIKLKIFNAEIKPDMEKLKKLTASSKDLPIIYSFLNEDNKDIMNETIQANYRQVKMDVKTICANELERLGIVLEKA